MELLRPIETLLAVVAGTAILVAIRDVLRGWAGIRRLPARDFRVQVKTPTGERLTMVVDTQDEASIKQFLDAAKPVMDVDVVVLLEGESLSRDNSARVTSGV